MTFRRCPLKEHDEVEDKSFPVTLDKYRQFIRLLFECSTFTDHMDVLELRRFIASSKKTDFSLTEFDACLKKMEEENKVMLNESDIFIL